MAGDLVASEEPEEESVAPGALASGAEDEVAPWSADFWHPARAKAKQKAQTLAEERRFMNYLRVG